MQQPNVAIHSGIVETGIDEIELHSSYLHIENITFWITGINKAYYEQPKIAFEINWTYANYKQPNNQKTLKEAYASYNRLNNKQIYAFLSVCLKPVLMKIHCTVNSCTYRALHCEQLK